MSKHEITMKPNRELPSRRIYANFAKVFKSPFDITIQYCDVPPIYDINELIGKDFIHDIPVVAEIAIPLNMAQGLIDALKNQISEVDNENVEEIPIKRND